MEEIFLSGADGIWPVIGKRFRRHQLCSALFLIRRSVGKAWAMAVSRISNVMSLMRADPALRCGTRFAELGGLPVGPKLWWAISGPCDQPQVNALSARIYLQYQLVAAAVSRTGRNFARQERCNRGGGPSSERYVMLLFRFGGDLLSHTLRCSTIGAKALNGRVRNGAGCFALAMTTKPKEQHQLRAPVSFKETGPNSLQEFGAVPSHTAVYAFDPSRAGSAWLLLDQIKPIEQLVPVN